MFMQLHEFVNLLEARGLKPRQLANGQWKALCPAHNDTEPSLSFTENDGRILVKCFAGCGIDDICAALSITTKDLRTNNDLEQCVTLSDLAQNDRQLLATLRALGCTEQDGKVGFSVVYADGTQGYHYRVALDGKDKWRHQVGGKASEAIFALHHQRVQKIIADYRVVIVTESPLDAAVLLAASKWTNLPAISVLGKNNAKAFSADLHRQVLLNALGDSGTIFVWEEPDADGFAQQIADALQRPVKAIFAPDAERKDAYRLWLALNKDWDAFAKVIHDLVAHAVEVIPQQPTLSDAPLNGNAPQKECLACPYCNLTDDELLALAQPVLDALNPVADAARRLCDAAGIVAEDENAQLLLLIATTRILPCPVHALVVGTTGAGKSALVNAISAAIPPCHRRTLVGTSARALLVHPLKPATLLNWLELPNLDSENIASTILRTLLWQDNTDSADYLLTEWVGGRAKARTLKLPRQITLISTRVDLPKDEQLVTRFFVVEVKETPEKRQSVLSAIARQWQDCERPDPDALRQPVIAFMEWAQRRTWRVVIPFADALMTLLSQLPPAERDYRDAANLLRLIAASAIWHFQHRQHAITDESVTVIADLADYALVRQLVAPAFAKTRAFALSEGERQIIDALRTSDTPMTVKEIAQALNLSPTAVRCRLNRLKAKEIVVDEQSPERREKVWRIIASATLMNDLLPTPEQVATMWRPAPDQPTPQNSQKNLTQDDEGSSVHAFMSVHDLRTLENAKQDWDFCTCVHAFTEHYLGATHQDEANPTANPDVIENGERTNASLKTLSSISENERSHPLNACERTNAADSGLEVKVTCPRCGSWRRVPPDAFMLADPRCPTCGEVMHYTDEDNPTPTLNCEPQPDEDGYIDTEAWIDARWAEVSSQNDQPAVVDLETNEAIPVAFPNLQPQKVHCPRCGHSETTNAVALLPPLCPACKTPMDWEADG
jgi:uncharacterized protein (DUF983 family)/energy-coupling factor transporter ATP-binding protein EcfA2